MSIADDKPANAVIMDAALPLESSTRVIKTKIRDSGYAGDVTSHPAMPDAVTAAMEQGKHRKASSLLLSPACASFDQYKDFEARGNHFKELIQQHYHS